MAIKPFDELDSKETEALLGMITFRCPRCMQKLMFPEDRANEKARCPRCQTGMRVPRHSQAEFDVGREAAQDAAEQIAAAGDAEASRMSVEAIGYLAAAILVFALVVIAIVVFIFG